MKTTLPKRVMAHHILHRWSAFALLFFLTLFSNQNLTYAASDNSSNEDAFVCAISEVSRNVFCATPISYTVTVMVTGADGTFTAAAPGSLSQVVTGGSLTFLPTGGSATVVTTFPHGTPYNITFSSLDVACANVMLVIAGNPPPITCPMPLTLACDAPNQMVQINTWLLTGASFDPCLPGTVTTNYNAFNFMGCGGSGSQMVTFTLAPPGGPITATCQAMLTISPPALPVINCPMTMPIACTDVAAFVPPPLGGAGDCGITWTAMPGPVAQNLACDGSGTLNWTYTGMDDCGRTLLKKDCSVTVTAAPIPPIVCPILPPISCAMAIGFAPPPATYTGVCGIGGNVLGNVSATNYDACNGGTITITYAGLDNCGRPLVPITCDVTVMPAPPAVVAIPLLPVSLTCELAATFMAPNTTYTNGLAGTPCDNSGMLMPTVTPNWDKCAGGSITVDYKGPDQCGNTIGLPSIVIPVMAAPPAVVTTPMLPATLTCAASGAFVVPDATFSNGLMGACGNNGTLIPTVTGMYNPCTGTTFSVMWNGLDECGNPLSAGPSTYFVEPAPMPVLATPIFMNTLTCEQADAFMAPDATYTNQGGGPLPPFCQITGTIPAMVTPNWDKCNGGIITVNYMGNSTACNYPLAAGPIVIQVMPAPAPTITPPPVIPTSLTCEQAAAYVAPNASYTNNGTGNCAISGTIFPSQTNNFSECGGMITISYMVTTSGADCSYLLQDGPYTIMVDPAPAATISTPTLPATITCIQADSYSATSASYTNGIAGTCNISGTIAPTIDPTWDKCGGTIKVSYVTTDQCNRPLTAGPFTIVVMPAPMATVTPPPPFPTSITCVLASGFVAPPVNYDNGITGNCNISGTISAAITNNWDKCGGTLIVNYSGQDMCGRPLSLPPYSINVEPAPEATITPIPIPTSLSCVDATTYVPPMAMYSNGLVGPCEISGMFAPTVDSNFDKCGGTIKVTYISQDMCGRTLDGGSVTITVEPAPEANTGLLVFAPSISCVDATTFMAPGLPYTNGLTGTCEISGVVPPTVTPNFDKCGGTITVTYNGQDMCGRPITAGPFIIMVDPAPAANLASILFLPNISCTEAEAFVAPNLPYTNGLTGVCEISGTVAPTVTNNWDKCGGTITIEYNGQDMCGRPLTAGPFIIMVDPAPVATVMQPVIPNSLSCADADVYVPPLAPYSNGLTGACEISGTVTGVVTNNFDNCGGTIMITYNGQDMCGRPIISASFTINVDPAPMATVNVPFIPGSISCENATTYTAPIANYDNGLTGVCNISGTINPVVVPNFDACGGTITITYNGVDDCGRPLSSGPHVINVQPAPAPTLTVPYFPSWISCAESINFLEHHAPYDNGLTGVCNISGFIAPVVNKVVDKCDGGFITLSYSGFDVCGNYLSAPTVTVYVHPAPAPTLTTPDLPMMINCWEAPYYDPGHAYYDNGEPGICNNSGYIYPEVQHLWESCDGGNILVRWTGYDDCGTHFETQWRVVMVMPDEHAPVGECESYNESFQFIYQTPQPHELGDYKYKIASNYWDYCSNVVVNLVGDTGEPVCQVDGTFERIYLMEVADECGNVADTCEVRFYGECNPLYCTLSQTFYGGESEPDSLFGYTSYEILDSLMGYGEDSIHIGSGSCSFILDDAQCIQNIITGHGTSYPINPGYSLNCDDELNNVLINQIIITILNVRYNDLFNGLDFGGFHLSAACQVIPHKILYGLPADPTVNDLIDYANDFLACQCDGTCGDFSAFINDELTGVFLALNSRFHGCHVPGPCAINHDCFVVDEDMIDIDIKRNGYLTNIDWVMNSDETVDRYELEKSVDGVDFTSFGTVLSDKAATARHYNTVDENPAEGTNFYRLKVFSDDGSFCYTDTRQVNFDVKLSDVNLYPNPTNHKINLTVHDFVGKPGVVEILNDQGIKVGEKVYQAIPQNILEYNVQDYVSGLYWITIKVEGHQRITKKFVVSKLDFFQRAKN